MKAPIENKKSVTIIMLVPLFFILLPSPNIEGIQYLTFSSMAVFFGLYSLHLINKKGLHKATTTTGFLMAMLIFCLLFSMFLNSSGLSSFSHLAKILLFFVVFIFGNLIGNMKSKEDITKGLLKIAYILTFIQFIVSVTQLLGIDVFTWLYSTDKASNWNKNVRVVGTLGNPNVFAWIVTQLTVIIYLFEEKMPKKVFWILMGFVLVFLSGSRTALLIFPAVLILTYVLKSKKTPVFYFFKFPSFLIGMGFIISLVYQLLDNYRLKFRYMSQILNIFETGDLKSVNSFDSRIFIWKSALNNMDSGMDWMFGLGPGTVGFVDNDFLYSTINYGLFFTIFNLTVYLVFIFYFLRCKDRKFMTLGVQYIVFSLIIGLQADALSGWNYPVLIMFYAGIALAFYKNKNIKKETETIADKEPSKRKRYKLVW